MPRTARALIVALAGLVGLMGCADEEPASTPEERFCEEVRAAEPELTADPVADPAAAGALADRFAELGELAPADIRDEWGALTELFRTVAELDPADPGFRAAVLSEVGRTVTAAAEVTGWVQRRCGVDLTGASLGASSPTTPPAPAPTSAPPAAGTTTVAPPEPTAPPPAGASGTTTASVADTVPLSPVTS